MAEEVGHQGFRHHRGFLVGNGVGFRPLSKIIHSDQEVSIPLVAPRVGPSNVNGYPFERGTDVVLPHPAPVPGSVASTGCACVASSAPPLNVTLRLKPVVSLPDLIQGFVDTQVTA
jgi:hypothetical protein